LLTFVLTFGFGFNCLIFKVQLNYSATLATALIIYHTFLYLSTHFLIFLKKYLLNFIIYSNEKS